MTKGHRMAFTREAARVTSIIEFRHVDGSVHGGVVGGTIRDTFSVVSYTRYGDTKQRRFRYEDVAEVTHATPRVYVPLETFSRLMSSV